MVKPQPPAYWDKHFVVALIDDFITEFQDSTTANIEMNEKPHGFQGALQLDRNENLARSGSHAKPTEFTVKSPLLKSSHKISNSKISSYSTPSKPNQNEKTFSQHKVTSDYHYPYKPNEVTRFSTREHTKMSRQLQTGMALPPFKRVLRKCHSGLTTVTIPPTNFASFTETT